ncbi:DUF4412 domain-containing protein [Aminithiophilus ramosus]|uniref:DUF4412 domain-containing protein n=1 Tax=Aminithiophilus ramosus TaxID=3029084 RepID=A0A9Q7EZI6_9BACT|nr:DUF4412 domain-containing protein [Aminithiophilus ramosus]QTX32232.1 DUF4412 domain-containing protein [Aminithiophilus ramosus]
MKTAAVRFFVILSLCLVAGGAWAANFEADMVIEGPMGAMTGKIYVKGDRQRQDMEGAMGRTGVITLGEDRSSLILLHDRKAYMEMEAAAFPMADMGGLDADSVPREGAAPEGMKMQNLGSETVAGYVCEKIRLVDEENGDVSTLIWFSHDLSMPLKAIHESPEGTSTVEYRNIVEGNVADDVFQVPEGYQKMEMGAF